MFDPGRRFSGPHAANTLGNNMEKGCDLLTASIAARARRLYPDDIKRRAAYFNEECTRHAPRYWDPASALQRAGGLPVGQRFEHAEAAD
jgi:hypothetical protein